LPISLLRRLALNNPKGPWSEIAISTGKMIASSSPKGFAPDWINYQTQSAYTGEFIIDSAKGDRGSYDAIRVYLWAGMIAPQDVLQKPMMKSLYGMREKIENNSFPPESVNTLTGSVTGVGPIGFSAALLPYLMTAKKQALLEAQIERIKLFQQSDQVPVYYDTVLSLFGIGWHEKRYSFSSNGYLNLNRSSVCAQKPS